MIVMTTVTTTTHTATTPSSLNNYKMLIKTLCLFTQYTLIRLACTKGEGGINNPFFSLLAFFAHAQTAQDLTL